MKVYVVFTDYGYDGMSMPFFVGSSIEKCHEFIELRNLDGASLIRELTIDRMTPSLEMWVSPKKIIQTRGIIYEKS